MRPHRRARASSARLRQACAARLARTCRGWLRVTILVILSLYLFGGSVIHGFAFTLLVGFLIGTYSSIFVASPIVLAFERRTRASSGRVQRQAS